MTAENRPESSSDLRTYLITFSSVRLGILIFLLLLVVAEWMNFVDRGTRLQYYRDAFYILFFFFGFGLNIFYLVSSNSFIRSFNFFRFQFVADIFLITWWVVLTGGTFSGFILLYILGIFFYGRFLGFKSAGYVSVIILCILFVLSCFQFYFPHIWGEQHIRGSDLAYNFILLTLALVLVAFLVRLSRAAENRVLQRLVAKENALHRAEELRFRVFDWLDACLVVLDLEGRITTINSKALEWTPGYDRNSIIQIHLSDVFPEFLSFWNDREIASLHRNTVVSDNRGVVFGFKITELPEAQGWMILFSDITKIQHLEKQVKEMEKLATVGELAAGLAHEMKNPLAGIKTSLQLMLSGDLKAEFSERLSKVILRDIDRLDYLLKDFLVFARPSASNMELLKLSDEIEHILLTMQLNHRYVQVSMNVGDAVVRFDRNHLHQILINLILNAFQAMEGRNDSKLMIGDDYIENLRRITITDNGPGIGTDIISKCFDPFVTSKSVGSGLGLSIARRLAAQNGAFISLENLPEGGARASLVFAFEVSTNSVPQQDG